MKQPMLTTPLLHSTTSPSVHNSDWARDLLPCKATRRVKRALLEPARHPSPPHSSAAGLSPLRSAMPPCKRVRTGPSTSNHGDEEVEAAAKASQHTTLWGTHHWTSSEAHRLRPSLPPTAPMPMICRCHRLAVVPSCQRAEAQSQWPRATVQSLCRRSLAHITWP